MGILFPLAVPDFCKKCRNHKGTGCGLPIDRQTCPVFRRALNLPETPELVAALGVSRY